MLSKQVIHTTDRPSQYRMPAYPLSLDSDRCDNGLIRELLRLHGLRTSLFRLKVLNTLALARREGRSIGVRGVHDGLGRLSAELSQVSVREVLKRLAEVGIVVFEEDKTCRFTPQAWAILEPCFEPL